MRAKVTRCPGCGGRIAEFLTRTPWIGAGWHVGPAADGGSGCWERDHPREAARPVDDRDRMFREYAARRGRIIGRRGGA